MVTVNRRASFVLAIACAVPLGVASAQEVTGTLIATVEDPQGAALRGASVRVSSPALIGGPQLAITNARGQLRFPALPPGVYALAVEFEGFRLIRNHFQPERPTVLGIPVSRFDRGCGFAVYKREPLKSSGGH